MAMNPINATITTTGTYVYGVDWRDAPNGFAYQVVFNAGASGSVTVDTTLDNVNDPSVTPVWTTGTAVTSTTVGSIASPVQFVRLSVNSLSGGTLGLKILQGAPDNGGASGGGGGGGGAVTIADGADVAEGSTTDAAAAAGGTGTVSAKLRRISAQLPAALGQTTMSASQPVAIASDQSSIPVVATGNVASGATDSGNPVKAGGVYNTTLPTLVAGQRGDFQTDTNGNVRVSIIGLSSPVTDGVANTAGFITSRSSQTTGLPLPNFPLSYNGTTWDRQRVPNLTSRLPSSAATTNATSSKASTAWLFSVSWYNTNAAARFLKIYNKASAPTVGTDTPVLTIALPQTAGNSITFQSPLYLSTGLAFALTVNAADADTTAVGAGDIVGLNLVYS